MTWVLPTFQATEVLQKSTAQTLRNGDPKRCSSLELIAYANGDDSNPAKTMKHFLDVVGKPLGIDPKLLRVTRDVYPSVRISWMENAWYQVAFEEAWDMVGALDLIRAELNARDHHEVFWSNAPIAGSKVTDKRNCATLAFDEDGDTPMEDSSAELWAKEFFSSAGAHVQVLHSEAQQTCSRTKIVSIRCLLPSDIDKIASRIAARDPVAKSHNTHLHRPPVIDIQFPTCIASPNRSEDSAPLLLKELDMWIAQFNLAHRTNESLLLLKNGERTETVFDSCVVMPSSMGLAQYLTRHEPHRGSPFEFCFELNRQERRRYEAWR